MPNTLGPTGLILKTYEELLAEYTASYQAIYGTDVNLDPSSPDGQMMGIQIQAVLDLQDLVRQVYNQFNPDLAFGVVLDQRVAINGIQRQAGTFTTTNITIVTSQALNLYGLEQEEEEVFTVADNAGTQWKLQSSQTIPGAGTYVFIFEAADPGAVLTTPNTITVPVTIVLGVVSVNNPTTYSTLGLNEESDAALKIRRQKSVSLSSQGYLQGLLAALENINGVTFAQVYENNSGSTDGDGVPGHSIWVIVAGSASDEDIANAIYRKRNAGAGMFGDESYLIVQANGTPFLVFWDVVVPENLFIKFTVTSIDGVNPPRIDDIRAQLPLIYTPGVFEEVDINGLATLVQQIDPNALVTLAGFSLSSGGSYTDTLEPSSKKNQFAISSPNIIILPMTVSPGTATVEAEETEQFEVAGGFGTIVWTVHVNNSAGSIDSDGLYTAGPTPATDTIRATDALGNFGAATVTVT